MNGTGHCLQKFQIHSIQVVAKWVYNGHEISENDVPEGALAFVYKITETSTGKLYVGKKSFYFTKTRQVKGKKKKVKVPSDWQDYWSSSEELQEHVKTIGTENFTREILRFCFSKGEASYFEAHYQFQLGVLLTGDATWNKWISVKVHKAHLKNIPAMQK